MQVSRRFGIVEADGAIRYASTSIDDCLAFFASHGLQAGPKPGWNSVQPYIVAGSVQLKRGFIYPAMFNRSRRWEAKYRYVGVTP